MSKVNAILRQAKLIETGVPEEQVVEEDPEDIRERYVSLIDTVIQDE